MSSYLEAFSKWFKLKIYQLEVTMSVYIFTPIEKFIFCTLPCLPFCILLLSFSNHYPHPHPFYSKTQSTNTLFLNPNRLSPLPPRLPHLHRHLPLPPASRAIHRPPRLVLHARRHPGLDPRCCFQRRYRHQERVAGVGEDCGSLGQGGGCYSGDC